MLDESTTLFRTGKMLVTDQSLCEAEAAIDKVERMVEVIDDHVGLLNRYSSENSTTFRKLLAHFDNLDAQMRDDRTTRRTMDSFEHTKHAIEQSTGMIQDTGGRRDPFLAHEEITALQQRSAEMDAMIVADRNAHAEASRAVLGAEAELSAAAALVSRAGRDNIPDSAATSDAIAELRKQESFLRDVRRRLESPHEDWADVAKHATQVNAELGKQAGRLRGELSRAAQCVEALRRASREVSAAAGYSGGFGVLVRGTPGVDDLESARRALAGGDYAHMLQLAGAAEVQARQAIMQAQRRIAERKREAARRAKQRGGNDSRFNPTFLADPAAAVARHLLGARRVHPVDRTRIQGLAVPAGELSVEQLSVEQLSQLLLRPNCPGDPTPVPIAARGTAA